MSGPIIRIAVVLVLVHSSCGHVALTFPPARKFDFDFLDNGRTLPPCGMPKGNIRTSLLAGSSFNVTWHLAYPHKGGFRLEVLDEQEKHVLYLTTNRDFVAMDPTAQHYEVHLPADFRCRDCTLRLVRQASEWGSKYQFFTCADIDILPRQEYQEDCSGQGRNLPGRQLQCRCNRLYSGPRCQNKEECIDDRDCGSHGKCIDIEATTAPRRQCFCEAGWFGPGCSNKSPVKNAQIDLDSYRKKELHEDLTLYWRIIKNGEEIEFAIISKGTSYVAIGWRPAGLTESCRKFPEIVGPIGEYEEPSENPVIKQVDVVIPVKNITNPVVQSEYGGDELVEEDNINLAEGVKVPLNQSDTVDESLIPTDGDESGVLTGSEIFLNVTSYGGDATRLVEPVTSKPESSAAPQTTVVAVTMTESKSTKSVTASNGDSTILNSVSPSVVESGSGENTEGEEYEVVEYYDDGNDTISQNENITGVRITDLPGGLLSLTPIVPKSVAASTTQSPSSTLSTKIQEFPKMETHGWKPITPQPDPDPENIRIPVSEIVPVDSRAPTIRPVTTRRITGLDKLKQKLSKEAEESESSVGKGQFRQVNVEDFQEADQGEWVAEQRGSRRKRSVEDKTDRQQRGFSVPIDDDEEEAEPEPEPEDAQHTFTFDDMAGNHTVIHDHELDHSHDDLDHSSHDHTSHDHSGHQNDPELEPAPEPEPEGELETKAETAPEPEAEPELPIRPNVDWSPRGALHGMDCTDIIIGMARGSISRINDYYTRDRSTPRVDTFFGGRNDLTAAFAQEVDGVTTLIFRRKTNASDPTDHPITPGPMHVIWAKGQESGSYKHTPKSGLETGNSSVPEFYKPDELKYHGPHNRGVTEIDFFATDIIEESVGTSVNGNTSTSAAGHDHSMHKDHNSGDHKHKSDAFCGGEWKSPTRCDPDASDCVYYAKWEYVEKTDDIKFTVRTNYTNKWIGIGFGESSRMSKTDAVIGWLDNSGRSSVLDMWILGYTSPKTDEQQNLKDAKIDVIEGKTTMTFTRKRVTTDNTQDVQFGDGNCVYFKYPVQGGSFNGASKRINKHEKTPVVSDSRICIRACPELASADTGISYVKGPEKPQMIYDWSVKVKETAKGFQIPEPDTEEFINFARHVADNLTPALEKIPGFQDVVVKSVSKDGDDVIAHISLILEEKKTSDGATMFDDSAVRQVITDTVAVGQIGRLRVDPQYIKLDALGVTSPIAKDEPGGYRKFGKTNLYIVIGCLAALFFIFVVQAVVTICTTRKSRSLPPMEQMITQSAWKDYSTSTSQQTNYAYESFGEDIKIASHSSRGSRDSLYQNARLQERMHITRNGRPKEITPVGNSLPRPHYDMQQSSNPYPSSKRNGTVQEAYPSYPSQFYPSHKSNGSAPKPVENQPDFYFMPSQRRYSGEVVRVYVDYNTRPK